MAALSAVDDPASIRIVESGPTFEVWKGPGGGGMRLDWTRQGAVKVAVYGHGHHQPYTHATHARWDAAARANPRPIILVDFWDMPTYDSGMRIDWTAWALKHRASSEWHVCQRSKLVHMGLTVANVALGGLLNIYDKRPAFDIIVKKMGIPVVAPLS
jgi:hypothetical protein